MLRSAIIVTTALKHVKACHVHRRYLSSDYKYILREQRERVGMITLHRPKQLNALCIDLITEVIACCKDFEQDDTVGCIIITGSEKAFAAGADIKEMSTMTYAQCYKDNFCSNWAEIPKISKPIIAAVSGYALGGGCELAMMCDIIIASDTAKCDDAVGTQRLIRAIGKSKAMELILTGSTMGAVQAEQCGLVSRVVSVEQLLPTAMELASKIASFSQPAIAMAKETVSAAHELSLQEGLRFERRIFHSMFALDDQKEGMAAFLAKRPAAWSHK